MPTEPMAAEFIRKLKRLSTAAQLKQYHRFFTFEDNPRPGADRFIGVRMGQVFALAKEHMAMPPAEVEKLLESPIHEARVGAVSIMDFQARSNRTPAARRKELFDLYLRRHDRIDSWDLVDRSAPYVIGAYLADKPRKVLYKLARSRRPMERRTAIVATGFFIRKRDVVDTFRIAELLLHDDQDLIHKATGWMLREAGQVDPNRLRAFLDKHGPSMPRMALRYAIEKLPARDRLRYVKSKKQD